MSWSSAASRSVGSAGRPRVFSTTANVWCSTSLCLCTGSCSSCRAASSGRNSCARPVETTSSSAARRRSRREQLRELVADPLSRTRSGGGRASARSTGPPAARESTSSCAANLAARSIRSGSSENAIFRVERRVESLGREILHAAERIDELAVGQPDRHRVDREVPPRQVGQQVLAERNRRLAVLLRVYLLAERRDLEERSRFASAHRAELHADQVQPLGPARAGPSWSRRGRASVAKSRSLPMVAPQQQIPNHPADQVELVTGQAETLAELGGDRGDLEARAAVRTRPVGHDGLRIPLRPRPTAHRTAPAPCAG